MPSKRLIKDPERYKTVMCTTWANTGQCPYNRKCQFAHGKEELRQRSPLTSQPPQQPQLPAPMVPLPLSMGVGSSVAATTLQGLALPSMWPSTQQSLHHLSLTTTSASSAAGVRGSSLSSGFPPSQPQMPPLPPGPPPMTVLPLPLPAAGAALPMPVKPAAPAPPPAVAPPVEYDEDVLDELACAAMKWNLTATDAPAKPYPECLACDDDAVRKWLEPLRCNDMTGKVEPVNLGASLGSSIGMDSPIEPALGKVGRESSFQTQMVRRAISFILEDGPNSPVNARRAPAMAA